MKLTQTLGEVTIFKTLRSTSRRIQNWVEIMLLSPKKIVPPLGVEPSTFTPYRGEIERVILQPRRGDETLRIPVRYTNFQSKTWMYRVRHNFLSVRETVESSTQFWVQLAPDFNVCFKSHLHWNMKGNRTRFFASLIFQGSFWKSPLAFRWR